MQAWNKISPLFSGEQSSICMSQNRLCVLCLEEIKLMALWATGLIKESYSTFLGVFAPSFSFICLVLISFHSVSKKRERGGIKGAAWLLTFMELPLCWFSFVFHLTLQLIKAIKHTHTATGFLSLLIKSSVSTWSTLSSLSPSLHHQSLHWTHKPPAPSFFKKHSHRFHRDLMFTSDDLFWSQTRIYLLMSLF